MISRIVPVGLVADVLPILDPVSVDVFGLQVSM